MTEATDAPRPVDDDLPDHVRRNRIEWDGWAAGYVDAGERAWRHPVGAETWGIWNIPETELHLLPDDLAGLDTLELGCGTGYVSAWLARRGARPVGIDNSEAQLATARRLQAEHGIAFPLIHGNAEAVPLPDASFDLAISEYGASIWADPYRWIPEASRLLRPGGRLVFLVNGLLLVLTEPDVEDQAATNEMIRPYFGLHRLEAGAEVLARRPPGPRRVAASRRGDHVVPLCDHRMGQAMAQRRGLDRTEARLGEGSGTGSGPGDLR